MKTPHQINEPVPPYGAQAKGNNDDFTGAQIAIRRAALRARQLAQQTGTDLIVVREGVVVRLHPNSESNTAMAKVFTALDAIK